MQICVTEMKNMIHIIQIEKKKINLGAFCHFIRSFKLNQITLLTKLSSQNIFIVLILGNDALSLIFENFNEVSKNHW